jgi:pimeloyl-ACP methyl ester carboxylesterase
MNPFRRLPELPDRGNAFLTDEERAFYVDTFRKSGFRGGVSWYRNFDRNWERHPEIGTRKIDVPCLMVTAEWDPVLSPAMAADMDTRCSDLHTVMIEGCGHWTMQEKPEELNAIMVRWLEDRF